VPAYSTKTTVTQQAAMARKVLERAGPEATLACIAAEEFFLFDELRSPYPFLRLRINRRQLTDEMIRLTTGWNGCADIVERTQNLAPVAFVIRNDDFRHHKCIKRIALTLQKQGYRRSKFIVKEAALKGLGSPKRTFLVYLPPESQRVPEPGSR
jgi:hypothetical protein